MVITLATKNANKARELDQLLAPHTVVGLLPDCAMPAEDGHSFADIATAKARYINTMLLRPAIGDDSGLCVTALHGAPGVWSARYAGPDATDEENVALLLQTMEGLADRRAKMVCALAYTHGVHEQVFVGEVHGTIALEPRGTHGFGYDSVFEPTEGQWGARVRTFAEMIGAEKHCLSHRARAAYQLKNWLGSLHI